MPVKVILHVECDVFLAKKGSTVKKRCSRHTEFESSNIVAAKNLALEAGWIFDTTGKKDKAMCPDCGPEVRPYMYGRKS